MLLLFLLMRQQREEKHKALNDANAKYLALQQTFNELTDHVAGLTADRAAGKVYKTIDVEIADIWRIMDTIKPPQAPSPGASP